MYSISRFFEVYMQEKSEKNKSMVGRVDYFRHKNYDSAVLDASSPAEYFYERRAAGQ